METTRRNLALVMLLTASVMISGCSALIPTEHKEQVAVKTAGDIESSHNDQVTKRSTIPQVQMSGWGNTANIKVPEAKIETIASSKSSTDANGSDSAMGKEWSKQPLWFKILMITIVAVLIFFLGRWVWRAFKASSPQAAAVATDIEQGAAIGLGKAHEVMAGEINRLKNRAISTTDPVKLAEINADLVHLTETKASLGGS